MLRRLLLLAVAGSVGAVCRYGLAGIVQHLSGTRFLWGTLSVNLVGCFAAGLLFGLFESRWAVSAETRIALLIGFVGAFTTFSAFMLETAELARDSQWLAAVGNLLVQNVAGAAMLFLGLVVARLA